MGRVEPDRAALEIAHRMLCTTAALDDMLRVPALQVLLNALARRHMRRRDLVDVKKLQANDNNSTVRDQND